MLGFSEVRTEVLSRENNENENTTKNFTKAKLLENVWPLVFLCRFLGIFLWKLFNLVAVNVAIKGEMGAAFAYFHDFTY